MFEVSVRIEGDDQKLIKKFGPFKVDNSNPYLITYEDPEFKRMVEETLSAFKGNAEDVVVTIKWTW